MWRLNRRKPVMHSKAFCRWAYFGTVYLVLIVYPNPVVSDNCPKGCKNCNESDGYFHTIRLVRTDCLHNSWMIDVPPGLPRTMGTLIFKSNAVKTIKTSSFQSYKYLKNLDLANNRIESIENRSFQYQEHLEKLDLMNNRLTNLTADMFVGLRSLEKLDLQNNRISSLSRGVFRSMTELKYLDLHDNQISSIEDGAFGFLDYLQDIELGGCQLKSLQAGSFRNLMSLRTIDLSFNNIESIDPDTFSCSPLLETLHLNGNGLKDVPVIVLSKLRLLKDLDLSENDLTSISSKAFFHNQDLEILNLGLCELSFLQEGAFDGLTNLRQVFLNENPLDCDCRLRWLLRFWNKSKDIFQEAELTNCTSPTHLSGKPLMDLSLAELKCDCKTCIQDAKCNGSACASCIQGGVAQSCNCSHLSLDGRSLCHSHNGSCICSHSVPKPTTRNCTFTMTNKTCDRNARLAVVGRRNISCQCNVGFQGDGVRCSDIDECAAGTNQCLERKCANTYGSYSCYCDHGYRVTKMKCEDINECDNDPCLGPSTCYNTPGSYYCECKSGHAIGDECWPVPNSIHIRVTEVQSTSVLVTWSNVTDNRDTIRSITILYRAYGTLLSEWPSAPEIYTPNTTQAVVKNLTPDTYYTIKVELKLIYNISIFSDVQTFQTKELPTKGKPSGSDGNKSVVIVTSSVVGSAVAIAIALSLIALFLRRKKPKTGDEETDANRPYLQDLMEMRMFSREANHENTQVSNCMDAWEIPRDRLRVGEKIGEGQFGIVLKGTLTTSEGPVKVAIKTIKGVDRFEMKDFMQEMDMMKEIGHHPNVVSLLGVSSIGAPLYIITEYVDGGDLLDLLRSSRRTDERYANMTSILNSRQLLGIALGVSKGMSHIALKKLVHRDLAARNVLMTTELVAKIADFGLARDIYCEGMYVKTGGGRLPIKWMSPDAIRDQTYTIKSDVWSFGILLWEIVTLGGSPYPGIPVNILLEKLLYGYRMPKPEHCSDEVYSIMEECWALDPSMRPSFDDLCEALSLLLSEEGHTYINIKAISAELIVKNSEPKEENSASV
ncbi:uncharacterized protein LOC116287775 isoform X2 [Actinia tenebrosa]|uniref:receptor protein-tyrosine kinase n=1 Tax=Actinia tenebrosa TaxID=6105 RepID=A0A6P8H441_ACTTE|nr:uncharacterized protein LOC116287775 isoform X2 [Actinia tenebrosa]